MRVLLFLLSFLFVAGMPLESQDLDSLVSSMMPEEEPPYVLSTFKSTRLVLGQSVETPVKKDLTFIVSHRFGNIKGSFYDMFGLDQAYNRLGFEYGINDRIGLSLGRNNFEKIYDGAVKARLLWQQHGEKNIPVSLTLYSGVFINTLRWLDEERENLFSSRLSYVNQLLIARKFGKRISIQLSPGVLYRNLVELEEDPNGIFVIGAGGKYQFARKVSVNLEYFRVLNDGPSTSNPNSFSLGFDFETGGHVFQLNLSNSYGSTEDYFIAQVNGNWTTGDLFLGFNIYRVFPLSEKRKNIY